MKQAAKRHPMTGELPDDARTWPIREGGSTGFIGRFGYTRNGGNKPHWGVDFLGDVWRPVHAAHAGTIHRAGFERGGAGRQVNRGYGSRIWLRAKDAVETRYAHLLSQIYLEGMEVEQGELIGFVGRTGNVGDGPTHVHFEVREFNAEARTYDAVNPVWWLHGIDYGTREGIARYTGGTA